MTVVEQLASERQKRDLGSARAGQEDWEGAEAVSRAREALCPYGLIALPCLRDGAAAFLHSPAPRTHFPAIFPYLPYFREESLCTLHPIAATVTHGPEARQCPPRAFDAIFTKHPLDRGNAWSAWSRPSSAPGVYGREVNCEVRPSGYSIS